MIIKLMSLNIWNYNHFSERYEKIIAFIKKMNPDIIALQEVRDDSRRNRPGDNQLRQLNKRLAYKHHAYFKYADVNEINKRLDDKYYDPTNPKVLEGVALLSKFPIVKTYNRTLKRQKSDMYTRGILCARINSKKAFNIFVVHFSADDLFSRLHLEETLEYAKSRNIQPIIVGDFNIRIPGLAYGLASKDYVVSSDKFRYFSYPSKKEILDYILIPKSMSFKTFKCIKSNISDHAALVAEIEV